MTYDMQAGQAVTAGYFGGYSAKMQDVGGKELELMQQALERKAGAHTDKSVHKQVCVLMSPSRSLYTYKSICVSHGV